jgi:hypothetical protein
MSYNMNQTVSYDIMKGIGIKIISNVEGFARDCFVELRY